MNTLGDSDGPAKPREVKEKARGGPTPGGQRDSPTATGGGEPDPAAEQRMIDLKEKIRKRVACEERAQKIVERLLDNPNTSQFMTDAGQLIQPSHYADVVEERAIAKQCGYPVCQNALGSTPKQKYHISVHHNKVFDITERKNFCSNQCYKASKFFESQISPSPVWARAREAPVKFTLLSLEGSQSKDIIGEEVMYDPRIELKEELETLEKIDKKASQRAQRSRVTGVKTVHDLAKEVSNLEISADNKDGKMVPEAGTKSKEGKKSEDIGGECEVIDLQELAGQVRDLMCLQEEGQDSLKDKVTSETEPRKELKSDLSRVEIEYGSSAEKGLTRGHVDGGCIQTTVQEKVEQLPVQGSQGDDTSRPQVCADTRGQLTVKEVGDSVSERTSVNKKKLLKEMNSVAIQHEEPEQETLAKNAVKSHSTESVVTVKNTTHNKTHLLMELLDRREKLENDRVKFSGKSAAAQGLVSVSESVPCGDTLVSGSGVPTQGLQQVEIDTAMIERNIKIKSESVLANIRRVASQQVAEDAHVKGVPEKKDQEKVKNKSERSILDILRAALNEWKTTKSVEFLTSRNFADEFVDKSEFERKYAALGMRVNALDMSDALGEESTSDSGQMAGQLPDMVQLERDTVQLDLKVREYFRGNMRYPLLEDRDRLEEKDRLEEEAEGDRGPKTKKEDDGPWESSKPVHVEPVLPLVDSCSQMAIRRKIVMDRLSKVMPDQLVPLRLTMHTVAADLRSFIQTLNFSSTNILFKPAEWRLVAYLLLRLLSVKSEVLRKAMAQEASMNYFRAMILSFGLAESHLDTMVRHMTSTT